MISECVSCGTVSDLEPSSRLCKDCFLDQERENEYTEECYDSPEELLEDHMGVHD